MNPLTLRCTAVRRAVIVLLGPLLTGCQVFFWAGRTELPPPPPPQRAHAVRAVKLRNEGKPLEAVREYEAHIAAREANPTRPPEENPAFYYLLIGDAYLEASCPKGAHEAYVKAREKNVEKELVVDRFRRLAKWFGDRACFEKAIAVLREIHPVDPLLIDGDIDAYHKKMIELEDSRSIVPPPPTP